MCRSEEQCSKRPCNPFEAPFSGASPDSPSEPRPGVRSGRSSGRSPGTAPGRFSDQILDQRKQPVEHGFIRARNEELTQALMEPLAVLDALRRQPLALAHCLLAVGDEALARTGRVLRKGAPGRATCLASPASQTMQTCQRDSER